eukprot:gnl/TRDRNA2_/TRDRNA2_80352_c0_seq1.p1 gnl/TRDRNA2_/TRDRNA2_80352_c0~~gnl/TRDRNA2_/TRDRNA2_80352_c0_seq1.p1  ORF type:complete len:361 (-),score=44.85 gnl/TRDRNA2_/TRDRNA2_80352_c0_seq1:9-1091(-)
MVAHVPPLPVENATSQRSRVALPLLLCNLLREHLGPQDAAWFSMVVCGFFSCCLLVMCFMDDHADDMRHWSEQPWSRAECSVLETGIAYTGDCSANSTKHQRRPQYNYSKCPEPEPPGGCRTAARVAYQSGRRLRLRRQQNIAAAYACHDVYLPWAHIQFEGSSSCGYQAGLSHLSVTEDLGEARRELLPLNLGSTRSCWLLDVDAGGREADETDTPCQLVSLQDPRKWPEAVDYSAAWHLAGRITLVCSTLCLGATGVGSGAVYRWWNRRGILRWADLQSNVEQRTTGLQGSGSESARMRRLREQWAVFRSSMLAEYQIIDSARNVDIGGTGGDACPSPEPNGAGTEHDETNGMYETNG